MFCSQCGNQIKTEAKFCHKCGAQLGINSMPPDTKDSLQVEDQNINISTTCDIELPKQKYERRSTYLSLRPKKITYILCRVIMGVFLAMIVFSLFDAITGKKSFPTLASLLYQLVIFTAAYQITKGSKFCWWILVTIFSISFFISVLVVSGSEKSWEYIAGFLTIVVIINGIPLLLLLLDEPLKWKNKGISKKPEELEDKGTFRKPLNTFVKNNQLEKAIGPSNISKSKLRWKPFYLIYGIIPLTILLLLLVWPTLYRYEHTKLDKNYYLVRINRITKKAEKLLSNGWEPMEKKTITKNLTEAEVEKNNKTQTASKTETVDELLAELELEKDNLIGDTSQISIKEQPKKSKNELKKDSQEQALNNKSDVNKENEDTLNEVKKDEKLVPPTEIISSNSTKLPIEELNKISCECYFDYLYADLTCRVNNGSSWAIKNILVRIQYGDYYKDAPMNWVEDKYNSPNYYLKPSTEGFFKSTVNLRYSEGLILLKFSVISADGITDN